MKRPLLLSPGLFAVSLLLVSVLLPFAAAADEPPSASAPGATPAAAATSDEIDAGPVTPGVQALESTHGYLSENIEKLADTIDSFFGDDRIFNEKSGTYLQLRGSTIYGKGGEWTFDSRVRAKVSLKNFNDRVQLLLSGDDDPTGSDNITSGGELTDTINDLDPAASLQLVVLEQDRWDVRLQPGVKLKSPLDPFFKIRFRRQQRFAERWLWRTTLYPAWYDSHGYEVPLTIDFERGFDGGGFFRSQSGVAWHEEESNNLFLQQTLLYAHPLGKLNQLAYVIGADFERQPRWQVTDYFASTRLRRDIHRGWLFLELKPQVLFERVNDYRANPSLALTLEMFFGEDFL